MGFQVHIVAFYNKCIEFAPRCDDHGRVTSKKQVSLVLKLMPGTRDKRAMNLREGRETWGNTLSKTPVRRTKKTSKTREKTSETRQKLPKVAKKVPKRFRKGSESRQKTSETHEKTSESREKASERCQKCPQEQKRSNRMKQQFWSLWRRVRKRRNTSPSCFPIRLGQ